MQITDSLGDASRWDGVKSVLTSAQASFAELAESWTLAFYQFGETCAPVELVDGLPQLAETADGGQTALGAALEDVLDREAEQRLVAVLLLSDGAQRAFAPRDLPPQTVVQRLAIDEIPLYTFTFGKPALALQSDLRVEDVLANDVVFAESPVSIQAVLGVDGFVNQTVKAQLLWETPGGQMEVVDTRELVLKADQRQIPVTFTHTPQLPGEFKVAVQIESPAGELVTANNIQNTFISVLRGGVRVLYLAGATRVGGGPGLEPRFVRGSLAAHADLQVQYELLNYRRPPLDLRAALTEGEYDVILLGNVDVTALSKESWQAIAQAVDDGTGLAMLGGFHSFGPGGFRGSPLEPLLPMRMGRAERQNFGEPPRQDMHLPGPLRMVPVTLGNRVHPILQLAGAEADDNNDTVTDWSALPALDGANRWDRSRVKPSAQVIAESPSREPLLLVSAWGEGRTLAFAGDSTWRWPMEGFAEAHRRFWRQLVLWLARKDENEGQSVWVRLDGRRFQRGSPVTLTFGALDNERQPVPEVTWDVQVEQPDGTVVALRPSRRGDDSLANFLETQAPGDYRVTVTGPLLGTAQARFTVPDRDMELDQPAAEPTLLASLAQLSGGGQGLAPEDLPELLEQLKSRTEEFEEAIQQQRTLWDSWPVLLTLAGLLGTEWYLRKRWGLV
jgi:uncharacterized membrane protein